MPPRRLSTDGRLIRRAKRHVLRLTLACGLMAFRCTFLTAQVAAMDTVLLQRELRVFLDCQAEDCGFDRLRTDISFVEWVSDRTGSDVHVLVTSDETAIGEQYVMDFIGQRIFSGVESSASVDVPEWYSQEERLSALTRRLGQGLLPFVARTRTWVELDIVHRPSARNVRPRYDPWRRWVFSLYADGSYFSQTQTEGLYGSGSFIINRTTEGLKLDLRFYGSYADDRFDFPDGAYKSTAHDFGSSLLLVGSLGRHASIGMQPTVWSSTYENIDRGVRIAPAFELNVFPYSESTRRRLTLRYSVGPNYYRYIDETIYDQTSESPWNHKLVLNLDLVQPWGSISVSGAGSQYLEDKSKSRLETAARFDLRIAGGFSVQLGGTYDVIRDQIFLPKGGATEAEVLLKRRELATDYKASLYAGIGFRFGSIFNSVVNSRFQ